MSPKERRSNKRLFFAFGFASGVIFVILAAFAVGINISNDLLRKAAIGHIWEIPEKEFGNTKAIITKVIDGDTVIIEGGETVRLLGIDADERGYPCYTVAKHRLEELTLGKMAELARDKEGRDVYNRLLRHVFVGGINVNVLLEPISKIPRAAI